MVDPLVLDLDGDGLEITPLSRGVQFDGNGDTIRTNTSWVDADDGLLVLDRNGNGIIDSGRELFGDETLLADGKKAAHGFAALAELDVGGAANATGGAGDGVFDAKDAQFTNVRVWRDLNQDGISQAGELQTLADAGIASVKLSSTKTDTSYGDAQLVQSGSFTRADGSEGQAGSFILAQNNAVTTHAPITISAAAAALPAIQGSGWVRGIQEAATLKPQLLGMFTNVQGAETRAGFSGSISDLLLEWGNESDHITASEEALEEEDIGLILRRPSNDQEIAWMDVAIKADKDTREAFRSTLTQTDRELFDSMRSSMVGQLEKLYAYEAFTGYTFLSWPTLRLKEGPPPESLRTGRPVPSWVPLSEIMKIDAYAERANVPGYKVVVIPPPEDGGKSHIDMLWDRLVEDATRNLLPSLRLSEYADKVQVSVSATGIGVDFSQLNAALDAASAADAQEGATLFLDMYRTYGDVFRSAGWDGVGKLRGLMQAAAGNPAIRAAFGTAGLNLVTASTQGTVNDDIFSGDAGENTFKAGAGDDFLAGGAGGDDLHGDMGNDILLGEAGDDWMNGDDGNDALEGGDGNDFMDGGAGDDVLLGGLGNDLMRDHTGNDTLDGQEGNDNLDAGYGDDVLLGGLGNDSLTGGHGNDTLDAGLGDDSYSGGVGNNTYLFGKGDGKDVISGWNDSTVGRLNVLRFKAGITPSELRLTRNYEALVMSINGAADQVTLAGFFQYNTHENANNPVQEVHFEDGTVWTAAAMAAMTRVGTEGNDALGGTNDADVMDGLGGNDQLWGAPGDDTLLGGTGNDALFGEVGNDRLEGQDGDDNLDASFGNDLLLGGLGNDNLSGGHDNDTLDGGLGDDSSSGGIGNNTYLFGKGDGKDVISGSNDTTVGRLNVLRFKPGIAPGELRLTRNYEALVVTINGTTDRVTLAGFFQSNTHENANNPVQEVHFEDGTVWTAATMAAMSRGGTEGNDALGGTNDADVMDGLGGNDQLWGGTGDDTLLGGTGNDALFGEVGNDRLGGQDGDDNLDASFGNDLLLGGLGNDNLSGGHDNDTLDGGLGNDSYSGGIGNNTYLFGKGDGNDAIQSSYDRTANRVNILRFKPGIAPGELVVTRAYEALVLSIAGTGDQMRVANFFEYNTHENANNPLQEVHFEDGTVWTAAAMAAMTRAGTEGNDALGGTNDADVMDGLGGNDQLWGGTGDDTLLGGTGNDALFGEVGNDRLEGQDGDDNLDASFGNDLLLGGLGNDNLSGGHDNDTLDGGLGNDSYSGGIGNNIYLFGKGDGKDGIQSSNDTTANRLNVLRFKAGVAPSEIRLSRGYESLVLSIDGTDDQVSVAYFFYNNDPQNGYNPLQEVHFEDGTVWNAAAIVAQMEAQRPKSSALVSEAAGVPAQRALPYADSQAMAAAFKPYELSASSPVLDDIGVYGMGAGAGSATLDGQVQQLLSAMASFAPVPGVDSRGFGDSSAWQIDSPLVAASRP